MIIKLKDGRYMAPVMMGSLEEGQMTQTFLGVDLLADNKDLFGRPATERFSVEDIEGFYGGYIFAQEQWDLKDEACASYAFKARILAGMFQDPEDIAMNQEEFEI